LQTGRAAREGAVAPEPPRATCTTPEPIRSVEAIKLDFFFKLVSINIFPQFAPLPPKQPFGISQISFIGLFRPLADREQSLQANKGNLGDAEIFGGSGTNWGKVLINTNLKKKIKLDSFI